MSRQMILRVVRDLRRPTPKMIMELNRYLQSGEFAAVLRASGLDCEAQEALRDSLLELLLLSDVHRQFAVAEIDELFRSMDKRNPA